MALRRLYLVGVEDGGIQYNLLVDEMSMVETMSANLYFFPLEFQPGLFWATEALLVLALCAIE